MPYVEPQDPDAELIERCSKHLSNLHAYNAYGGYVEGDGDPLWEPYMIGGMVALAGRQGGGSPRGRRR